MAEHRFHTPGDAELEINIPSGDIEVETHDGDETVVWVDGSEKLVEQTVVEQQGNRIVVQLKGKKPFGFTIEIGGLFTFGGEKLRVRARVPHRTAATLGSASADMSVDGVLRALETRTASGDLSVNGEVDGDAKVKTVSGDARLDRVRGDLEVTSVSGDIRAGEVFGSVK